MKVIFTILLMAFSVMLFAQGNFPVAVRVKNINKTNYSSSFKTDSTGNLLDSTYSWHSGSLYTRSIYSYDTEGNLTTELNQNHNMLTHQFWTNYEHNYTYDSRHNITGIKRENWDNTNKIWLKYFYYHYTYDSKQFNKLLGTIF